MPNCPKFETTRRGSRPMSSAGMLRNCTYTTGGSAAVSDNLQRKVRGRTIDAVDRRSKYLLFRMGANTLLMHFGHDRESPRLSRAAEA
jgi:formamidopyrimidine-DNA glycosylase